MGTGDGALTIHWTITGSSPGKGEHCQQKEGRDILVDKVEAKPRTVREQEGKSFSPRSRATSPFLPCILMSFSLIVIGIKTTLVRPSWAMPNRMPPASDGTYLERGGAAVIHTAVVAFTAP